MKLRSAKSLLLLQSLDQVVRRDGLDLLEYYTNTVVQLYYNPSVPHENLRNESIQVFRPGIHGKEFQAAHSFPPSPCASVFVPYVSIRQQTLRQHTTPISKMQWVSDIHSSFMRPQATRAWGLKLLSTMYAALSYSYSALSFKPDFRNDVIVRMFDVFLSWGHISVCVCVCVCERERACVWVWVSECVCVCFSECVNVRAYSCVCLPCVWQTDAFKFLHTQKWYIHNIRVIIVGWLVFAGWKHGAAHGGHWRAWRRGGGAVEGCLQHRHSGYCGTLTLSRSLRTEY